MKRLPYAILAAVLVILGTSSFAYALSQFTSIQVGSSPVNGRLLQTDGTNSTWVATSTLGLTASAGGSSGQLQYNASGALGGVSTTTVSCSGNTTCTQFVAIGPSPVTISSTGGTTFGQAWEINGSGNLAPTTTIAVFIPDYLKFDGSGNAYVKYNNPGFVFNTPDYFSFGTGGAPALTLDTANGLYIPNNLSYRGLDGSGTASNLAGYIGNVATFGESSHGTSILGSSVTLPLTNGTLYVNGSGAASAQTGTSGNCVNWGANGSLGDAGSACGSGTGGSGLATSSPVSGGNVLAYSAAGAGSAYGVATSTPTAGTGISYSGTLGSFVGGLSGTFTATLGTSITPNELNAALSANSIPYSNSAGTAFLSVATTSVTCAGTVSCTQFSTIGGSPITITGSGGGSGTVGSGTTGQFPYYASNGTTLTATSSIFQLPSGGIGFGTTTLSTLCASEKWCFDNTGSGFTGIGIANGVHSGFFDITSGGTAEYGTASNDPLQFFTNNQTRVTVSAAGNVGIGSTTPGSLFSIGGNGTGTNFVDNATTTKNGVGGYNIAQGCYAVNGTCISSGSGTFPFTPATDFGINTSASTTALWGQNSIFASSTSATIPALSASNTTGPAFTTGSGNVGFGTTSPYATLSVSSTSVAGPYVVIAGTQPLLQIGSAGPTYGYLANDRLNIVDSRNDYSAGNIYNLSANTCATADWTVANDLNATALNFGDFGHTSSFFTGSGCTNNPFTGFGSNSTYLFDPSGDVNFAAAAGNFKWFNGGYATSNQTMTLTSTGQLGLGTTSPYARLSIVAPTTSATKPLQVWVGVTGTATTTYGSLATSTVNQFGFGTSTPTTALSVVAASTTSGTTQTAYAGIVAMFAGFENTTLKIFLDIDQWGRQITGGDAPAITSCGTSPSFIGAANDNDMTIQVGSVSATGCTATFAHAWPAAPTCTVTERTGSVTNAFSYTVSTTAVVVTQTALTSDILDIRCEGTQ